MEHPMRPDSISRPTGRSETGLAQVIDSDRLFGDRNEVLIRHHDAMYRLRITKSGKLILNK